MDKEIWNHNKLFSRIDTEWWIYDNFFESYRLNENETIEALNNGTITFEELESDFINWCEN